MNSKIGIIGFGFVGQALYGSLKGSTSVSVYDKYKKGKDSFKKVIKCDTLFICVSTPTIDGKPDATEINEVLLKLSRLKYKGIVVLKSTAPLAVFEDFISQMKIVYNPEFLSQNTSVSDFKNQKIVVLGGDVQWCDYVRTAYQQVFDLPNAEYEIMTIPEATHFKYMHNVYHAYQVLFWNYVQEVTENSRKHVDLYERMYGRKPIMSQISPDGKLGYGGACFPKDVAAMNWAHPHTLTEFMINYNKKLRPDG